MTLLLALACLVQEGIDWKTDYAAAAQLAKQQKKPLHVYFTAKT